MTDSVRQVVLAEAGYAYGVIGADLHVVPGRGPAYLLANYVPARTPPRSGQPSYLLNARSAVVAFVGRHDEVRDLTTWRDSDHGLAIRWLHAPGGQGKTRLAGHLADGSIRGGWKVIVADHTAGTVHAQHPTSQDLRIGAATGLLLVVDYADRWPLAHLTWLLSNKVLDQDVPVRVLLLARASHVWPALCHALVQAGWPPDSRTVHHLGPSARGSRGRMFTTARDSFARHYRLSDPNVIRVPDGLERDEFGLTLAIHMAALVAVDRHARAAAQPPLEDMTGLTAYLLDRERHHWHTLHDTGAGRDPAGGRAVFGTAPQQMSRVVFTAALTGPLSYRDARTALETVGINTDVLADHTFCYPPADPRTVLEPLYPDRLAEDFLALSLPGHDIPGPWADAWADGAPELLLTPATAPYAPRAITFLTAASDRWPHLQSTLEALAPLLPLHTSGALTIAAADLTERLANHRLAAATNPVERALIHTELGERLASAGRNEKAESAFQEAVRLYRSLVDVVPADVEPILAAALANSAGRLVTLGLGGDWLTNEVNLAIRGYRWLPPQRHEEAMTALGEALGISHRGTRDFATLSGIMSGALMLAERWQEARALASATLTHLRAQPGEDATLVAGLDRYVMVLLNLEEPAEALPVAEEAVRLARRLARDEPGEHEPKLLSALRSYARVLHRLERHDESSHAMREAVRAAQHTDDLRSALEAQVQLLADQDRWDEALPAADQAVRLARRLTQDDPDKHEESLAGNLYQLALILSHLNRRDQEVVALEETIAIRRRLARKNPAEHEHLLSAQLAQLGIALAELRRWHDALTAAADSVEILQRMEQQRGQQGVESHLTAAVNSLVGPEWRRPEPRAGFDGDLAPVVETFMAELSSPRRGDAAFPGLAEAIEELRRRFAQQNPAGQLYRQLTGADPLAAEPALPGTGRVAIRGAQALTLRSLGRHEEALPPACEATQICRRLARNDPRTYEPMLVDAWVRTAVIMGELGIPSAAALEMAIATRRRLVQHDRARHEPALAAELAIMGRTLAKQGRWTEAVAKAAESVEIQRRLEELSNVDDTLAAVEEFLVSHLVEAELRTEHLAALRAAIAARRAVEPG